MVIPQDAYLVQTSSTGKTRRNIEKRMKQLSKKDHSKKKPNRREEGHWEGKCWCNCRTRGYRIWLGIKKYGKKENETDNN